MVNTARIVMAIYGVAMMIGGIGGYAKAHSKPSLIAGIASGLLMGVAYFVSRDQPRNGLIIGMVVALSLVLVFMNRIRELLALQPPGSIGMNIVLCVLSAAVGLYLLFVLVQTRA